MRVNAAKGVVVEFADHRCPECRERGIKCPRDSRPVPAGLDDFAIGFTDDNVAVLRRKSDACRT
jgi:hypothetical protein